MRHDLENVASHRKKRLISTLNSHYLDRPIDAGATDDELLAAIDVISDVKHADNVRRILTGLADEMLIQIEHKLKPLPKMTIDWDWHQQQATILYNSHTGKRTQSPAMVLYPNGTIALIRVDWAERELDLSTEVLFINTEGKFENVKIVTWDALRSGSVFQGDGAHESDKPSE